MTPNSLDNLDTEQKRMEAARQHFEQALELRRPLARQNPAIYLPDMANHVKQPGKPGSNPGPDGGSPSAL